MMQTMENRGRPDFRQVKELIGGLQKMDEFLRNMFPQTEQLREKAAALCTLRQKEQAAVQLQQIDVDELRSSRAGIRTGLLKSAGYRTLYDLYQAGDDRLYALNGVGEKQVRAIRMITDEFLLQLSGRERIRLSNDPSSVSNAELVCALARYRLSQLVCHDAQELCSEVHQFLSETIEHVRIRSRIHWLFSRSETKEETVQACEALQRFSESADYSRADRFAHLYLEAVGIDEAGAFSDFEKNSASYYALMEDICGGGVPEETVYGSIPARLAAEISRTETDLGAFRGDLRKYQQFGVKYVLHQKKVLLGDEMGLGKTIQAIAVMAHLYRQSSENRFLVVCPASVMINWCREIAKFSEIRAVLLHGPRLQEGFETWKAEGGAAVTNYESLRHITDQIDRKMVLALLVIDEAHYIKNPQALRTKYIHRMKEEAEHILLMTGTPLENRVDEMCELISLVRPDLVGEIRTHAGMRRAAAFREMLSPVYLRRQADQVLDELPDLIVKEEWCAPTPADEADYAKEVQAGNFMTMRRVSFLQEDPGTSSKAMRLLELCLQAAADGKKTVVFSYFRETLQKVRYLLEGMGESPAGGPGVVGEINGSTPAMERQALIDRFGDAPDGSILLLQIQAGGTGVNIQTASVVIFCEPQIKPSLEKQAIARVYRMGQLKNVLVFHLLCTDTVDEAIRGILEEKEKEFALYADESVMADAEAGLADREWIRSVVESERRKYLPAVVQQS